MIVYTKNNFQFPTPNLQSLMLNNMKILVTGGAGFIGSHTVVSLIEAGYEPVIIDNFANSAPSALEGIAEIIGKQVPFYKGDCNDAVLMRRIMETEAIQGVIHFAAHKAVGESVANPLKYYENNIGSMLVLLNTMRDLKVSNLIFSSSCTVYGIAEHIPVTEETPVQPAESPYGNTKRIGEEILRDVVKSGANLKAIALRYFNPIGAHPSAKIGELPLGVPSNLVPFITQTAVGLRESLTIFGNDYDTSDGTCLRDYIHVLDLADAHVKALDRLIKMTENTCYEVYNVGTGVPNSVLEVVQAFEEISGKPLNYTIGARRDGDVPKIYADVSKVEAMLEWKAQRNMKTALEDAWRWQQNL